MLTGRKAFSHLDRPLSIAPHTLGTILCLLSMTLVAGDLNPTLFLTRFARKGAEHMFAMVAGSVFVVPATIGPCLALAISAGGNDFAVTAAVDVAHRAIVWRTFTLAAAAHAEFSGHVVNGF